MALRSGGTGSGGTRNEHTHTHTLWRGWHTHTHTMPSTMEHDQVFRPRQHSRLEFIGRVRVDNVFFSSLLAKSANPLTIRLRLLRSLVSHPLPLPHPKKRKVYTMLTFIVFEIRFHFTASHKTCEFQLRNINIFWVDFAKYVHHLMIIWIKHTHTLNSRVKLGSQARAQCTTQTVLVVVVVVVSRI